MPLIGRGASNALRGIAMTRGRKKNGEIVLTEEGEKAAAAESQNARIIMAHNARPFVPPMTLQDYEDSEKEKADSLEFLARRNSRNDEAARRKIQNDLLEDSFQNYDMSGFEGGARGSRKKKYTQTRQKKQHRRRHRRRSTRKHKK